MKTKLKLLTSVLLVLVLLVACFACQPAEKEDPKPPVYEEYNYQVAHTSSDRFIYFESSDAGLDDFVNDYVNRHMRDDPQTRVGDQLIGYSTRSAWREWDSLIGGWWDASAQNGTMSKLAATNDMVNEWLKLEASTLTPYRSLIDNQGYVWCEDNIALESWGMGWEFPNYTSKQGGGKAWGFSGRAEKNDWTLANSSKFEDEIRSSKYIITTLEPVDSIEITTMQFNVSTISTPFLRIGFSFEGQGDYIIDDLYVQWQTNDSPNWSEDKKVNFSEFSTRGRSIGSGNLEQKDYTFPMYLNPNWGADFNSNRRITALRITLEGQTDFQGTLAIDYVASEYDDRQPLNNCNYILAAKNNLEFSRDKQLLTTVLPNARRAMNFLLYTLNGNSGLISTEYLVGHFNNGDHSFGTGIGNGYWDVTAFPNVNLYCNISYYNTLVAMHYLETMAETIGIPFVEVTTINAEMTGTDTYDASNRNQLAQLIELCKERIQTEFWNADAGRFHAGEYDTYGGIQDHGYLMFNEQVLASGLATDAQAKSVLEWINGERLVEWDDSVGSDIWYFEFAPRFNTHDIGGDFVWLYSTHWNGNVQNGGTALHLTYYDVLAQSLKSADSAFESFKKIQNWYEKVHLVGGVGKDFYRAYYDSIGINLQGGGTAGLVGVDYEFLEAALMFRAIPDTFFGMSTRADGYLCFAPNLTSKMDWWRIENLVYSGYYYDVSVGKYFLQISNVGEYSSGTGKDANLMVTLEQPLFDYTVCIDGVATNDYFVKDGKVQVQVPFGEVKVEIRGL